MEKQGQMKLWTTLIGGLFSPSPISYYFLMLANRIAAAPLFPNLRRFPQGRRFKQWTGDDSKALMKVC